MADADIPSGDSAPSGTHGKIGRSPSSFTTKPGESESTNGWLRTGESVWPLDPDLLSRRGEEAGIESGEEWKSGHHSLLARLRLDLQQYVDLSLNNLRTKLSDPLGPAGSQQSQGPGELVRRAEEELKRLELRRKYGPDYLPVKDPSPGPEDPDGPGAHPSPGDSRDIGERSEIPWIKWLQLVSILASCVMVEAVVNIGLLMDALSGGALSAFLLALVVSIINVGGFGIGLGVLLSWIYSHIGKTNRKLYLAAFSVWFVSVIAFNLIAGRHRETYAQVVERVREAPTDLAPATRDLLVDVSFNPLTWEFQALLFTLLGILLCSLGFVKGFTFIQWNPKKIDLEQTGGKISKIKKPTDNGEIAIHLGRQIFDKFISLPQRYCGQHTDKLRSEVANWYSSLDQERRNLITLLKTLDEEKNRQACLDQVEHAFIVTHNNNYRDKIDIQSIQANRHSRQGGDPLTVTASDPQVLVEAGELVSEWEKTGQSRFEEQIMDAHKKITDIWDDYKALVLGKPTELTGGPKALSWTEKRS